MAQNGNLFKKRMIIATVVAVVAVSVGVFLTVRKSYEIVSPKKGDLTEAVYGLGTVKSKTVYEVKLGVLNSIRKVFYREGDFVEKGSVLINFYEGPTFKAPFSGTLTEVNFHEGEIVPPQVAVMRMEDLKTRYIEVSLEQEAALRVSQGQTAKILFESIRNEVLKGKVETLFPRNGEFIAHIDVEKLSDRVLPGMTADVTIEVGSIENATLIPIAALHNGMVIIRRDGKKRKIPVKIGHVDSLWAEVSDDSVQLSDEILIPVKRNK